MGRILKNSILGHVRHVLPCALARASRAPPEARVWVQRAVRPTRPRAACARRARVPCVPVGVEAGRGTPPPGAPARHAMWCRAWACCGLSAGSSWAWVIAMGDTAHPHPPGPRLALVPYVPVVVWGWARDTLTVRRVQGRSERLRARAPCSARDPRGRGR